MAGDTAPDFYAEHVLDNRERYSKVEVFTAQAFLSDPAIKKIKIAREHAARQAVAVISIRRLVALGGLEARNDK